MAMGRLQTFAYLVCLLLLVGCSSEEQRWAVKGKVSLDGNLLKEGTIFFENKEKGIALSAPIGADGVYLVASYKGAGLPQGTYVVSVSPNQTLTSADQIPLVGKNPLPPKDVSGSPIPLKYRSSESSDIQIEVKVGINPSFDINLKREP
jgi:hypothetical protein